MVKIADLLHGVSFYAGITAVCVLVLMLLLCAALCCVSIWKELSR